MATRAQGEVVGMVLCAGLGTRLRPLTDLLPKPAAPVGGVPLVQWALALLAGAGVRRVVVNAHHLAAEMAGAARRAAEAVGVALEVSHEPAIAGTGGALREARRFLTSADQIIVLNGDVLFDLELRAALEAHRESGALASMVLMPMPAGATYNAVEVDRAGLVRRIARDFGPGLAEEIGLMLDEGVVAGPEDIDLCVILGAGWPMHLGGITPYLDRVGASDRVNGKLFNAGAVPVAAG